MVRILADPADLMFDERCIVRESYKVPDGSLRRLEHAKIGIDQEITVITEVDSVAVSSRQHALVPINSLDNLLQHRLVKQKAHIEIISGLGQDERK